MTRTLVVFLAIVALLFSLSPGICRAQPARPHYRTYEEMTALLRTLASEHKDVMRVESIGTTVQNRNIWAVSLRKGDPGSDRALLIVAGVEALQAAGSEYALRFIERTVEQYGSVDSVTRGLEATTIYVIPRLNPDAMEAFFQKPLRERTTNFTPSDDDHDGTPEEDGPEDLNKDGFITMMRVKDARGEWIPNPEDPRLMRKADAGKGERGIYRVYEEGIDNDKDEQWNEDPAGGVDVNRNFAFNYEYFGKNAGTHPMSEAESRSLATFIFSRPALSLVFSFSSSDNLTTPWKAEPRRAALEEQPRSVTAVLEEDQPYYEYASRRFLDLTGLKGAPKPRKTPGGFCEWVYYHVGLWSFSVRPWWPGGASSGKDTSGTEQPERWRPSGGPQRGTQDLPEDESTEQLKALKWQESHGVKSAALPWAKISHPDFPGKEVEVGGPVPWLLWNPPAESLEVYARPYLHFMSSLPSLLPRLAVENARSEKLNDRLYRLTLDVVDNGYLPTNSRLGDRVRWPRDVTVTLALGKGQAIAAGKEKQVLQPIKGSGGRETVTWLIVGGPGSAVTLTAGSPIAGTITQKITLQ